MMTFRSTARRAFVYALAAVPFTATLGWPSLARSVAVHRSAESTARRRLTGLLHARESAALFGERYLRDHPQERNADRLTEEIFRRLTASGWRDQGSEREALTLALHIVFRNEFAAGDVVRVYGWLLARSEARFYALYAL